MRYDDFKPNMVKKTIGFNENICVGVVPCPVNGTELELNMAVLSGAYGKLSSNRGAKLPAIIWLAGGGWRRCDPNEMVAEVAYLAENGYAVFFPKYRHSGEATFPACIADVQSAIRYIRAHADELGVNPERMGIIGRSAGGHLSALAAMNYKEYEGECMGEDWTVQAAVDLYGPADLVDAFESSLESMNANETVEFGVNKIEDSAVYKLFGCTPEENPELWKEASPTMLVSDKMCPMLIFHGTRDKLVDYEQSVELYEKIEAMGRTDCDFYTCKGYGHGADCFFQPDTRAVILEFFNKHLL